MAGRKQKWGSERGTWLDFSLFDKQRYLEASWKENIKFHSDCCCCFPVFHFGNKLLMEFCFKWFQCLCLDPCWGPGKEEFDSWFLKWSWKPSHRSQQRASWIKYCQGAEETEQEMGKVHQEDTLCELQVSVTLCLAKFKAIFSRLNQLANQRLIHLSVNSRLPVLKLEAQSVHSSIQFFNLCDSVKFSL